MDVAGSVGIFADITGIAPPQWDLSVLLSALAIAEKTLKMVNMSVYHMDDGSGLGDAISGGIEAVGANGGQTQGHSTAVKHAQDSSISLIVLKVLLVLVESCRDS